MPQKPPPKYPQVPPDLIKAFANSPCPSGRNHYPHVRTIPKHIYKTPEPITAIECRYCGFWIVYDHLSPRPLYWLI